MKVIVKQLPKGYDKPQKPFLERISAHRLRRALLGVYAIVNSFVTLVMMVLIVAAPTRRVLEGWGVLPKKE